jgi:hypothetical protein
MKKPTKAPEGSKPKEASGDSYKDRDLCGTSPLTEQFEPTPETPVNQHKRMAGAG